MPIQDKLAYALDRNDQEPNKILAREIVDENDKEAVRELITFIESGPHRRFQMDATLTLAYICEGDPGFGKHIFDFFVSRLDDPIERVGWGSMIGLAHITPTMPAEVFDVLPKVLDAMRRQSVVGRDYGFRILVILYDQLDSKDDLIHIVLEQIMLSPLNQVGQYTERIMKVIDPEHKKILVSVLEERREEMENEHHLKRINKNLKKLYK